MTNITVLNSDLEAIGVLDRCSSFIWTDRYDKHGEFELCLPVTSKYAQSIKKDYYLRIPESKKAMVVETIKIETDSEDGNTYNITGRSLESILDRRIVWKPTNVAGSVQNAIQTLMNENVINPIDSRRRIDKVRFIPSEDPRVIAANYAQSAQYMGETILDIVEKVCKSYHLGFELVFNDGYLDFSLFAGVDRSYNQTANPYVVFSPSHDNLLNSNYLESIKNYKNVLWIGGEGEGATRTFVKHFLEFDDNHASEKIGLARREIYIDCHDVSSVTSGNTVMDVQQYTNTLVQKGVEKLADLVPETAFEGEIDATIMYKYHDDYEVGDICEIRNEYGMNDAVRITEVVQTWEADGYTCIPTLESLTNEQGDTSSGSSAHTTIKETVETTSTTLETAGLKVCWQDIYGSSEDATVTYLSHSNVKMTTQLMSIKYYSSTDTWRITILKDDTSVYNKIDGTTVVYDRMRTIEWTYSDLINYEVSHTS